MTFVFPLIVLPDGYSIQDDEDFVYLKKGEEVLIRYSASGVKAETIKKDAREHALSSE